MKPIRDTIFMNAPKNSSICTLGRQIKGKKNLKKEEKMMQFETSL